MIKNNLKLISLEDRVIDIPNITSVSFLGKTIIFTDSLGFFHKYECDKLLKFEFEFVRSE